MPVRLRASTAIGVLALAFWAVAIPYAVQRYFDGDERGLLRLGSDFRHPAALAGAPMIDRDGYDGQFFAALATDPLLLRPETPLMFDAPAYRAGRVGLPIVAWALAAGHDRAAILLYQLLCWSLGALVVWVIARWVEEDGASPWWAAPLILGAGMITCTMGSMPDAAAATLMTFALWRHARGRPGATPLLAAAALIRDTSLVAAAAIALFELRARRFRSAALSLAIPALAVGAWRAWVLWRIGANGVDVPGGNFALPFSWLPEKLAKPLDGVEVLALVALGLTFAGLPALVPAIRRWTAAEATYAGLAAVNVSLSRLNYLVTWWGYARTVLPLAVLAVVIAARPGPAWRRWTFRAVAIAWCAVGAVLLYRWAVGLAVALAAAAALLRATARGQAEVRSSGA